ncbi:hypothetical protein [Photobacterium kasasachensis]|uniref:hypothetical protein n=1 Tax=Photobacterium kasasachensis TaxID=2910240 RepID=UPI003D0C88BF
MNKIEEEELVVVPVPALVAVLLNKEKEKGSLLTEDEVLKVLDNADSIVMPRHALEKVEQSRGYIDIDPEHAWEEWKSIRSSLHKNS